MLRAYMASGHLRATELERKGEKRARGGQGKLHNCLSGVPFCNSRVSALFHSWEYSRQRQKGKKVEMSVCVAGCKVDWNKESDYIEREIFQRGESAHFGSLLKCSV